MIKIGMMIGDRYEILEKIGTGGMSDVYKAKCHKLNRFVAVKVLKQEFCENANFVSKFRIEAQAAAGLMHPNIVNVYDVGEEGGIHYIVMELVEGITLKKYIEKKARLSYKEAVSIAIQICMGIEAAHNNHIIHRDIKPQNIIISKDGKVKVTDFGIAKAATSNTITSNVMGSVHYTSPEQARGGYSDEKSDIYSLGISLFEMLTGRVPFNGETTVAIAIKHIQEELPLIQDYVMEVPSSVEGIVQKCCQKSPDRRYQSMAELIADLKQSLMNPEGFVVASAAVDTQAGTRMMSKEDMEQIKRKTAPREEYIEPVRQRDSGIRLNTEPVSEEYEEEYEEERGSRMEKITTVLAIGAGVIICIIIIVLMGKIMGFFNNTPSTPGPSSSSQGPIIVDSEPVNTDKPGSNPAPSYGDDVEVASVPYVLDLTYEEAFNTLADAGFKIKREESYSTEVEKGRVISQTPSQGEAAPVGSEVVVTVSIGASENQVKMPNLIGLDEMDATVILNEAGLSVKGVSNVYHDEVPEGLVCYQEYSHGVYLEKGTGVEIKISKGQERVTYKCNISIEAPTKEEAPDYVAGNTIR
ncbi:MAG: Stk1 family PASTA domain-containing Ser/Thr kinase, partial [Lachnospiraceae bacterium]|nr:Stk1 family PASTA domain-containing Ser/Thr kinase [Lachnospiraceae bacterium]